MKIEIYLNGKDSEDEEMAAPTPFQRKVAKMLAQRAGRKQVTKMDLKLAADLEDDAAEGEGES
jgi:hypothetical protein